MLSIVIAAHNEEAVLGRCLSCLLEGTEAGEFEIIVVCNGCTDRTADVARVFAPAVLTLETPVAGKNGALNIGDAAATAFPRFYVDADVEMRANEVRKVARVLDDGQALAAAPRLVFDLAGRSWAVRTYYRIWSQVPWMTCQPIGGGVYAVSKEGRDRLGGFEGPGGDDLWVSLHFRPGERRCVEDAVFRVPACYSLWEIVRNKSRTRANRIYMSDRLAVVAGSQSGTELGPRAIRPTVAIIIRNPLLLPHWLLYVVVAVLAALRARWKVWRNDRRWEKDRRLKMPATDAPQKQGGPNV